MRIVVTGATGNIGTALLRRLRAEGSHELVGIARRLPRGPWGRAMDWRSLDLSTDTCLPGLTEAFRGADAVVHLVWGFQPTHDQNYLTELDIGGTRRVLRAVTEAAVPHLVHFSSLGVYSPKQDDRPVTESWPTGGIPSSWYSRHKVAAERMLDHLDDDRSTVVTRIRPGIVGQRSNGSSLLRYTVPAVVPALALGLVPVLPLDRHLAVSMVHADDLAEAVAAVLRHRSGGAFNLAAPTPVTAQSIAEALGARLVHVPSSVLRPAMALAWRARLQAVDPGWLDMGMALPTLDATRARVELGWAPRVDGPQVMAELLSGMRSAAAGPTPIMRPRSVPGAVADAVRRRPAALRRVP